MFPLYEHWADKLKRKSLAVTLCIKEGNRKLLISMEYACEEKKIFNLIRQVIQRMIMVSQINNLKERETT